MIVITQWDATDSVMAYKAQLREIPSSLRNLSQVYGSKTDCPFVEACGFDPGAALQALERHLGKMLIEAISKGVIK